MNILGIILSILFFVVCIGLITLILLQSSRNGGLSGSGISSMGETYWGKNKGNSLEGKLEKYTKILAAAFIIIAILLNVVIK